MCVKRAHTKTNNGSGRRPDVAPEWGAQWERKRGWWCGLGESSTHVMAIVMVTSVTNKRERWTLSRREEDPGRSPQGPRRETGGEASEAEWQHVWGLQSQEMRRVPAGGVVSSVKSAKRTSWLKNISWAEWHRSHCCLQQRRSDGELGQSATS